MTQIGQTTGRERNDGLYAWSVKSGNISVSVTPQFRPEQSAPDQMFYYWSYHVQVRNLGHEPVQLSERTWIITDGAGHVQMVEGEGVIGLQPWIEPDQTFEYESCCPLRTPTGNMRGWYLMKTQSGRTFKVRIPLFFLKESHLRH